MKDFNAFLEECANNMPDIMSGIFNQISDVSVSQRTVSKEEWDLISTFIVNSNITFLSKYHEWLSEQLDK